MFFIGYDTIANANNETNQIVIGHSAIGNGSNSVTLGNDLITKTVLKGQVIISLSTSTPIELKELFTTIQLLKNIMVSMEHRGMLYIKQIKNN